MKLEKKEPLVESQLFIMELARELNRICQVSSSPLSLFALYYLVFCIYSHCLCTSEIKYPVSHLDRRGHLDSQRVPGVHRGMGCCAGEKSAGTR